MYVTEFELESFCGGPPLRFLDLGNGLNVALAPSAGAVAQLLHVIPGTLFGDARFFSSSSSETLVPTRRTAVLVRTEDGVFRVERSWGAAGPLVTVTTGDGQSIDGHRWDAHRARVSAAEYADVFTFDVRRLRRLLHNPRRAIRAMQALARELDDAPATRTTPTIRLARSQSDMPLDGVLAELSRVKESLAHTAQNEIAPQVEQNGSFERPDRNEELRRAERALRESREQLASTERDYEQTRAALNYLPIRDRLAALELELAELPNRMTAGATIVESESLQQLDERILLVKSEWKTIRSERAALARQRKEWEPFQKVDALVPRLEAVLWQEKPLLREEDALRQLRARIEDLEKEIELDRRETQSHPKIVHAAAETNILARLDALSDRLRDAERERDLADQALAKAEVNSTIEDSVEYTVAGASGLTAMHSAQQRVANLRDQLDSQGDERKLRDDREVLDRQIRQLYRDQLLPLPTILAFGIPFALGAALIIHALLARVGAVNWQQILWGFVIAFVTVLVKILRDRECDRILISARRRLARIDEQLAEIEGSSSDEDDRITAQLQAAERELKVVTGHQSELAARSAADEHRLLEAARRRSGDAGARVRDLAQQWRALMIELNLSPSLTPAHAREALAERARRESETAVSDHDDGLDTQLRSLRQEWERRHQSLRHQMVPFRQLAEELGHAASDDSLGPVAETLHQAVREAKDRKLQREQMVRTDRRLLRRESEIRKNGRRLIGQRHRMRAEMTRRREQLQAQEKLTADRREQLIAKRDRLQREANALLSRSSLNPHAALCAMPENELTAQAAAKSQELATVRERLVQQAEHHGQLRGQREQDARADSSSSWTAALDSIRPIVDDLQNLQDRVRSLADRSREATRAFAGERRRESRYMHLAARHLRQLSKGEYPTMGLRGSHRQLVCRNQQGRWRSLGNLQVAQYANVYFALWLARLEQYAARGIRFPIILRDPLMVTTSPWKAVIARTLKRTAANGHQMVLVTDLPRNASVLAELGVPIADVADRHALTHSTMPQPFSDQARSNTGESNPRIGGDPSSGTFLTVP